MDGSYLKNYETIWGQPPPISIAKWVFVTLAYVNKYFYQLTGRILVSRSLSPIVLGYFFEFQVSSERAHRELGWEEMPPLQEIAQDLVSEYRAELEAKKKQ